MYNSSYIDYNYNKTYYNNHFSQQSYYSNQYYKSKMYDDHRFQRRKLQKPAFLIRQQSIYPQSSTYSIGSVLDYADSLTKPYHHHQFYTEAAQEERIMVQGRNPFLNQSADKQLFTLDLSSRMKKSSRSRLGTNPNLGVTSYQVLEQNHQQDIYNTNRQKKQRNGEISSIKKPTIEQYIADSLIQNFAQKHYQPPTLTTTTKYQNTQQQQQPQQPRQQIKQRQKRQTFNPGQQYSKKITSQQSTIIKPKKVPQQLIYKGKKYVKLIN